MSQSSCLSPYCALQKGVKHFPLSTMCAHVFLTAWHPQIQVPLARLSAKPPTSQGCQKKLSNHIFIRRRAPSEITHPLTSLWTPGRCQESLFNNKPTKGTKIEVIWKIEGGHLKTTIVKFQPELHRVFFGTPKGCSIIELTKTYTRDCCQNGRSSQNSANPLPLTVSYNSSKSRPRTVVGPCCDCPRISPGRPPRLATLECGISWKNPLFKSVVLAAKHSNLTDQNSKGTPPF